MIFSHLPQWKIEDNINSEYHFKDQVKQWVLDRRPLYVVSTI